MSKVKTATATSTLLHGGKATLHNVYFVGPAGGATVTLQDATASGGTVRANLNLPTGGGAQSLGVGGGGLQFHSGIFGKTTGGAGVTIVYATS